jgi:superfamily II DNA helicase RecQ
MTGQLRTSSDRDEDADLSCDVSDLLNGKYPVLLGHPESFDSILGQHLLRELQRHERLLLVCIDEFHQGGQGHWSSFRPDMMKMSTGLRLYGVQNCPSICMTATATNQEIKEVIRALGLQTEPVILTASLVQSHIKFSVIRRPWLGRDSDQEGSQEPRSA